MKIDFSIIYNSEFGPQTLKGSVSYEPEPFCDREDILTAVHRAAWSQLKACLKVDEKALDAAVKACHTATSTVEAGPLDDDPYPNWDSAYETEEELRSIGHSALELNGLSVMEMEEKLIAQVLAKEY